MSLTVKPLYTDADKRRACKSLRGSAPETSDRTVFSRDYARPIHSPSFRRLQGKTQLFPGVDSDFFRTRLTHSLEVAQIARAIARKLNATIEYFRGYPIDEDLVSFAGMAHDLGHPPFGHNGEKALDEKMCSIGGFEGNAQTLRILSRVENKTRLGPNIKDRYGLDLCYRSLASILKYNEKIPLVRASGSKLVKGYYESEASLVIEIKKAVAPRIKGQEFKTVECQIMDAADDIAYSTYDLEDALKAGFVMPLDMTAASPEVLEFIATNVSKELGQKFDPPDVIDTILEMLISQGVFDLVQLDINPKNINISDPNSLAIIVSSVYRFAKTFSKNGMARTQLTSSLVNEFINGIECTVKHGRPCLSEVRLKTETHRKVEVLKYFSRAVLIDSPMVKLTSVRGREIVEKIFEALSCDGGAELLPDDHREYYEASKGDSEKQRVICDFIAGMTDSYTSDFYSRLISENPQTIFRPH